MPFISDVNITLSAQIFSIDVSLYTLDYVSLHFTS